MSTPSPTSSYCRLLELPGALQTRIYRLALANSSTLDRIDITTSGYARSGLLRTNKSIRKKTYRIFYIENYFTTTVLNYNGSALMKFFHGVHVAKMKGLLRIPDHIDLQSREMIRSQGSGEACCAPWSNLMEWLQQIHSGSGMRRRLHPQDSLPVTTELMAFQVVSDVVRSMFIIAGELQDLPWYRVRRIMVNMRPGLVRAEVLFATEVDEAAV